MYYIANANTTKTTGACVKRKCEEGLEPLMPPPHHLKRVLPRFSLATLASSYNIYVSRTRVCSSNNIKTK